MNDIRKLLEYLIENGNIEDIMLLIPEADALSCIMANTQLHRDLLNRVQEAEKNEYFLVTDDIYAKYLKTLENILPSDFDKFTIDKISARKLLLDLIRKGDIEGIVLLIPGLNYMDALECINKYNQWSFERLSKLQEAERNKSFMVYDDIELKCAQMIEDILSTYYTQSR